MKDDGTLLALGAMAVVVGAGLVRRGSRMLYDVEVTARNQASSTKWYDIEADDEAAAQKRALRRAGNQRQWEWQVATTPPIEIEVENVEPYRRSLRDLRSR